MLCLLKAALTRLKSRLFSAFQAVWQRANTQEVTAAELGHAEEADGGVRRSSAPATVLPRKPDGAFRSQDAERRVRGRRDATRILGRGGHAQHLPRSAAVRLEERFVPAAETDAVYLSPFLLGSTLI